MAKIDDKINFAERKLEEIKAKFGGDKADLAMLIQKQAKLEAEAALDNKRDTKGTTEIERQRDGLRSQLEIYPDLVKEVERKIETLRKEKEEGILKENLLRQRKAARKVEELSQELGTLLERANETNMELQKCRSMYLELHKLTNQDVFTKPTTGGSQGWLRVLTGTVKAELAGKGRQMPRYPGAAPPI